MSFIANLSRGLVGTQALTQTQQASVSLQNSIDAMKAEISLLRQQYQKPWIFLKSSRAALSSNVANDVLIIAGIPVPPGYRGVITDFNLTYTTVAGTVKWVILDTNTQILATLVAGMSASQNGEGATVIEEGQRFGVVGQTAGAGTFDTYCTGYIYKVTPY